MREGPATGRGAAPATQRALRQAGAVACAQMQPSLAHRHQHCSFFFVFRLLLIERPGGYTSSLAGRRSTTGEQAASQTRPTAPSPIVLHIFRLRIGPRLQRRCAACRCTARGGGAAASGRRRAAAGRAAAGRASQQRQVGKGHERVEVGVGLVLLWSRGVGEGAFTSHRPPIGAATGKWRLQPASLATA